MPLYAAHAEGMFADVGLELELLPPVAHTDRIARLRSGAADLALIDLAAFVDAVAIDPALEARCVFVLTQHLPEAAFSLGAAEGGPPAIAMPRDLIGARYGGRPGARLTLAHQALLRRLGGDPGPGLVAMPYEEMFAALSAGEIDVLPDFAALEDRVRQAAPEGRTLGVLRYRDCSVDAYGIGFVASGQALAGRRDEVAAALGVVTEALWWMRDDPRGTIRAASALLAVDAGRTLAAWDREHHALIFEALPDGRSVGSAEPARWRATAAWRAEVTRTGCPPGPDRLFETLGSRMSGGRS